MTLTKAFLVILFAVSAFHYNASLELALRGWQYISYDLQSTPIETTRNDISFSFKTVHPSGLLVHSGGSFGDFITIELVHGKLR